MLERLLDSGQRRPTFVAAVCAGEVAGSVGEAFLAGYRAALRCLVPSLPEGRAVCLCATEEGGAHPRAIATRVLLGDGGPRLTGRKKWVTGAPLADLLLVVASQGIGDDGRNRLVVARVEARAAGVTLHPQPPTPFVPEIPHAEVTFDSVLVDELLPGDGYDRYLKPFRTVEDIHVFGAVLGHLFARAQEGGWPAGWRERLIATLAAFERCAAGDPLEPATHLVLAGSIELGRQLASEAIEHFDPTARATWQRDLTLLSVASKARASRAEAAWRRVTTVPGAV